MVSSTYKGYRFPCEVISHCVAHTSSSSITVLAGTIAAGAATGSATAAPSPAGTTSPVHVRWTVHNGTDQDLTAGTVSRLDLDHPTSTITVTD